MPKIKATDGCVVCGRTDTWTFGILCVNEDGKKIIVKLCFGCLAMQNDEKDGPRNED